MHKALLSHLVYTRRVGGLGFILSLSGTLLLIALLAVACTPSNPDDVIGVAVTQTLEAATQAASTDEKSNMATATPALLETPTQLEVEPELKSEKSADASINSVQRNSSSASTSIVPDGALMRLGRGSIETMDLSPEGELIAVGGSLGVFVYSPDTLEEMWFSKTDGEVKDLAFSPDGSKLAAGMEREAEVLIFDPQTGNIIKRIVTEPLLPVTWEGKLEWHPDSTRLAVALQRPEAHSSSVAMVWDSESGDLVYSFDMPYEIDEGASALAWSPNGEMFAAVYDDMGVVWDSNNGRLLNYAPSVEDLNNISHHLEEISWYPNSTKVVLAYEFGMTLWDVLEDQTEEIIQDFEVFGATTDGLSGEVEFSRDGNYIALAAETGEIMVWDTQNGQFIEPLDGHFNTVHSLEWSPDGEALFSASFDDRLAAWNTRTWEQSGVLLEHTDMTFPIAWSPDSTKLVTGGYGLDESDSYAQLRGIAEVWSLDGPQILHELESTAAGVAWSSDGSLVIVGDRVFQANSGDFIRSMEQQQLSPFAEMISLSSDNEYLVAPVRIEGQRHSALSVWDFESGKLVHTLEYYDESGDLREPTLFDLSPDNGNRLAVRYWGEPRQIVIYDVSTGEMLQEISPEGMLDYLAWLPDGSAILGIMSMPGEFSNIETHHIVTWDPNSGEVVDSVDMQMLLSSPELSPDGRLLAFLGQGQQYGDQIVIWDISANQPVSNLGTLDSGLSAHFSWSPNGELISSNQGDGTLLIWDVDLETTESISSPESPQPLTRALYLLEEGRFNEKRVAVNYFSLSNDHSYTGSASKFVAPNNPIFAISKYEEFSDVRLFSARLSDDYRKHYDLVQELDLTSETNETVLELRPIDVLYPGWYCVVGTENQTYYELIDQWHYEEDWWCFEVR